VDRLIDAELARISERIRDWRAEAGLTLQELADKSGLAASTIQKVETAQMVPSVAVLLKVARGLGRHASELVQDASVKVDVAHLPARDRQPIGLDGRMQVERVSGDLTDPELELWRVTLHPGVSSGRGSLRYDGEGLVVCERGALRVKVGDEEYGLATGDSLHFKASIPHRWWNPGRKPARFLIAGTVPHQLRAMIRERADAAARRSA